MVSRDFAKDIAAQLETEFPTPDGFAAEAGGMWPIITALKDALLKYDVPTAARAIRDLLNQFLGEVSGDMPPPPPPTEGLNAPGALNWGKLIALLLQILPMFVGQLPPAQVQNAVQV